MPEEVIQSTFTSTALNDLFPLWTEDPSKARPICMARFGTGDQAVDWTQTNVHNPVEKDITNVGISVITGDSTTANVRVAVEVTNSTDPVDPMRGKVLKEMGLFIDDNPGTDHDWKMVWVSKLPDMRVPKLEESGITMSFLVTVPIKFDNSDQIHLITDNAQLETRMDNLENAIGEKPSGAGNSTLWQYVRIMNGSDTAKPKADSATVDTLQTTVTGLQNSKADKTVVNDLSTTVSGLSNSVNSLSATKADKSTVTSLSATVGTKPAGTGPNALWDSVGSRGYANQTDPAANSLWGYVKRLNGGTLSDPRTKADYDAFVDFRSSIQNGLFNSNRQAHCSLLYDDSSPSFTRFAYLLKPDSPGSLSGTFESTIPPTYSGGTKKWFWIINSNGAKYPLIQDGSSMCCVRLLATSSRNTGLPWYQLKQFLSAELFFWYNTSENYMRSGGFYHQKGFDGSDTNFYIGVKQVSGSLYLGLYTYDNSHDVAWRGAADVFWPSIA